MGLILLASSSLARAQEPALTWQAPQACPSRDAWLSSLRARVDPKAWRMAAPKLRAAVRIEQTETGYALQLDTELDGAAGQRRIESALCAELVEASALIVALAIDPGAAERAASAAPIVPPSGEAVAPTPVETSSAPPRETAPADQPAQPPKLEGPLVVSPPRGDDGEPPSEPERPRQRRGTRFFVRPLALLDSATLPEVAFGPSLQGGVRFDRLSLEVGVSYLLGQSLAEPGTERVIGDMRWLGGSAGTCYNVVPGSLVGVAPCARIELGWLWGQGRNLENEALSGGALWLAFEPGVWVGFELFRGLSFDAQVSAALPVLPSAFTVGGVGRVHESPAMTARLSLGASLYF